MLTKGESVEEKIEPFEVQQSVVGVAEVTGNFSGGKAAGELVFGLSLGIVNYVLAWFDGIVVSLMALVAWVYIWGLFEGTSLSVFLATGKSIINSSFEVEIMRVPGRIFEHVDLRVPVLVRVGVPWFVAALAVRMELCRATRFRVVVPWYAFAPGGLLLLFAEGWSTIPSGFLRAFPASLLSMVAAAMVSPLVYARNLKHGRGGASFAVVLVAVCGLYGFSGFCVLFMLIVYFRCFVYVYCKIYRFMSFIESCIQVLRGKVRVHRVVSLDGGGLRRCGREEDEREEWFEVEERAEPVVGVCVRQSEVGSDAGSGVTAVESVGGTGCVVPVVKEEAAVGSGKVHCEVCGFQVKADGHRDRCRPARRAGDSSLRADAWLGDALHALDVRAFLLRCGCPEKELEGMAQLYVGANAQAKFYRGYAGEKRMSSGESDRSLSQAFEASYRGRFRDVYAEELFQGFEPLSRLVFP